MATSKFYCVAALAAALSVPYLAASTPAEISLAGNIAGRHLFTSEATSPETDFQDQWARLVRISRYDRPVFADPADEAIWDAAEIDAKRALEILARIAELDNNKPSDWNVVVSAFNFATEDTKNKERQNWAGDVWRRILFEAGKSVLQSQFRTAEQALDRKLAELAATVRWPDSGGLGIGHLPSWQGAYQNDMLILRNDTGRDLSNAAVFVTFYGTNGSSLTHLHHASAWAANQKLYFQYPYYDADYASGQTVNHPTRVQVSVCWPEGAVQFSKLWSGDDYDALVRQYLRDLHYRGTYLGEYVEDGTNTVYYPGVKFSTSGLQRLPVKRITVRFIRRGETKEVYWDWNKYVASGNEVVLRSQDLAAFGKNDPPEQKQVILEFTDSSVIEVLSW